MECCSFLYEELDENIPNMKLPETPTDTDKSLFISLKFLYIPTCSEGKIIYKHI